MEKHVVSFSGGKDSTAMLLRMLELGMRVDHILCADTGMEFPQLYTHINKVQEYLNKNYNGLKIKIVKSEKDYKYYMFNHEKTRGKNKGKKGYMWMDFKNRWCTSELKQKPIRKFFKDLEKNGDKIIEFHGIAVDEQERTQKNNKNKNVVRYPLVEWNWTEEEALNYCYKKGFDWEGLYKNFARLSCYLCPLQRIGELREIYNNYPELWEHMQELDSENIKRFNRRYRQDYSIKELTEKFEEENKQISLF